MRLAITQDFLNQFGGAERVLETLSEIYPNTPIYTFNFDKKLPLKLNSRYINPSFMNMLPFSRKMHYWYLPFYAFAAKTFDLKGYDIVFSNLSAWTKNIRLPHDVCHIVYCNTPIRFAWEMKDEYLNKTPVLLRPFVSNVIDSIKIWDIKHLPKNAYFITISDIVKKRIKNHYGIAPDVIYPPVKTDYFTPINSPKEDYYLIASRLVGYKKIDVAISAFNELGRPLKITGVGPELKRLKKIAGRNIEFLGSKNNEKLRNLYQNCKALIFPGEEDLGLVPIEVQACGRPVIAFAKGGLLETVIENETGVFFKKQDVSSLIDAVNRFKNMKFDPVKIRNNALRFDEAIFKKKIKSYIESKYNEFLHKNR